jgi:flavin-dependent dehydrogenase
MTALGGPLKILICGGGCAGPALAYWLARSGHRVVVVERFPALRASCCSPSHYRIALLPSHYRSRRKIFKEGKWPLEITRLSRAQTSWEQGVDSMSEIHNFTEAKKDEHFEL